MNQRLNLKDCYMTIAILGGLLMIFITEMFMGGSENNEVLLKMGAMSNYAIVAGGQWWRLFTAQFLHIGVLHLVSNAVIIYYMGQYMEPIMGHWRFLFVYLLSGVGGNLLSLAFGSDKAISAGASTAIFGLFGAMVAIGLRNMSNPIISYLARQAFVLALINIVLDLFAPNIDIQGHLGGLIAGFLLAIIAGDRTMKRYSVKWRVIAFVGLVVYVVFTVRTGMVIKF
ncbi:rhomboid family intramembrane serine protease [Lactobacillus acetotolerans]|jgi:rhomboid protease GluP|uniref:Rhomboid family intramembrane serine protease n=3 Tax=Lactobacillus acetotolerans TaxID=1600 RepID=A0A5P5ZI00_9LACO|nr:rhomboid family intramembrane serine protease [Lactobacillus acetotolerans]QFG51033.1 rhomboid family intramembrane serine protease [Lactobacillus acetotolerans]QJD73764.1 rhomboid family intramembrane serine protease [Lactobacillus acetotolerans]GGV16345.1 rhomboid family intramembrane serine protease [Lactobacillus acetotolerans DSM 20749 = JCM 3825]